MNKIQNIVAAISIVSLYITSVPAIANPSSHKIGFVEISKSDLGQMGTCGYSIIGSKNQNDVAFFSGTTENALMNIDGKNISLKSVSQKKVRSALRN